MGIARRYVVSRTFGVDEEPRAYRLGPTVQRDTTYDCLCIMIGDFGCGSPSSVSSLLRGRRHRLLICARSHRANGSVARLLLWGGVVASSMTLLSPGNLTPRVTLSSTSGPRGAAESGKTGVLSDWSVSPASCQALTRTANPRYSCGLQSTLARTIWYRGAGDLGPFAVVDAVD